MTANSPEPEAIRNTIRRVLAAFHGTNASAAALESVIALTARFGAELEVLFIEDEGLLGLAELPFIRQVSLNALPGRPFVRTRVEAELRALARGLERSLGPLAARQGVGWTFRTVRGQPGAAILAAAEHADLLIVGASTRPLGRVELLETSLPGLVARIGCPVLVQRREPAQSGPVHVLLAGAKQPARVLATAAALAERRGSGLVIMTQATERAEFERALQVLKGSPGIVWRRVAAPCGPALIEALLARAENGILVLDATCPEVADAAIWRQLASAFSGVLLTR
jgi:nucleotide-binding universal stress UspA family protein